MVVAPVDQCDVDGHVTEPPSRHEATEPGADDDDSVPRRRFGHGYRPGLECMIPPSANTVVAVM